MDDIKEAIKHCEDVAEQCGNTECAKDHLQLKEWLSALDNENVENVENPKHYTSHPSGVECIEITQHYDFCIGNAIKYLWRAGIKTEEGYSGKEKEIEDLQKAVWYINHKIEMLKKVVK